MSTSHHYRSNLRDIFFNLFEFLDIGKTTLGKGPFSPMDEGTARESLVTIERIATQEIAPSLAAVDLDRHVVGAGLIEGLGPEDRDVLDAMEETPVGS